MNGSMSGGSVDDAPPMFRRGEASTSTPRSGELVIGCNQCPKPVIGYVVRNGFEMQGNIKTPSGGPPLEFGLDLCPLFLDPGFVPSLMMEQQGRRLNEALDEQNLLGRSMPLFQSVPQRFPRLVGVPEFPFIEQGQAFVKFVMLNAV